METKKDKRKKDIANSAYNMLIKSSVNDFSLNKLLEEISMSKGNFYHYFSSKDELFCKVLELKYNEIYEKYVLTLSADNFEEKLSNIFFIYTNKNEDIENYLLLIDQMYYLFSDKKNKFLYNYMQSIYSYLFTTLEYTINEEINLGNIKPEAISMVKAIAATADGMLTHSFIIKDYDLQKELKEYFSFLANNFKVQEV